MDIFLCWLCAVLCASTLLTTKRRDFGSDSAPASSAVAPRPMAAMAIATTTTAAESWDMVMMMARCDVSINTCNWNFAAKLRTFSNWIEREEMVQSLFGATALVCFAALPLASTSDNESVTVSDPTLRCRAHLCPTAAADCPAAHHIFLHFTFLLFFSFFR